MKEFIAEMVNGSLEGELDDELGYEKYDIQNKETDNSRNGYGQKTLQTSYGEVDVKIPRDRQGEYEPKLIGKHKRMLDEEIERKIISMYAKGMTTGDMEAHIKDLYELDISDSTISRITDKVLPIAKEYPRYDQSIPRPWQMRAFESVYAVVYLDAIHYHVRHEGRIVKKAVYIAIGVNLDGIKDILGLWVGENESSKLWLSVINEMKNRGVQDILIASVDGLSGFSEAISAVFPET
jgi:transposase-like protein